MAIISQNLGYINFKMALKQIANVIS